jgi:general secretion pathway protein C
MKQNSKIFFISASFAILVSATINFLLPNYGVDKNQEAPYHDFHIYKIGKLIVDVNRSKPKKPKPKPKPKEKVYNLKKWKLIATYLSTEDGFAVIKDGKKIETIFLNHLYKGYELVDVNITKAVFKKSGKLYSLELYPKKKKKDKTGKKKINDDEVVAPKMKIKKEIDPNLNAITSATVKRKDIQFFTKHINQIWKNIRLRDYRVNRRLRGFKVTYVKKGSAFEDLGLRVGDIITAINGEEIKSYSQVQRLYKNIDKIKALNLTISRNGEEIDINYEIN